MVPRGAQRTPAAAGAAPARSAAVWYPEKDLFHEPPRTSSEHSLPGSTAVHEPPTTRRGTKGVQDAALPRHKSMPAAKAAARARGGNAFWRAMARVWRARGAGVGGWRSFRVQQAGEWGSNCTDAGGFVRATRVYSGRRDGGRLCLWPSGSTHFLQVMAISHSGLQSRGSNALMGKKRKK